MQVAPIPGNGSSNPPGVYSDTSLNNSVDTTTRASQRSGSGNMLTTMLTGRVSRSPLDHSRRQRGAGGGGGNQRPGVIMDGVEDGEDVHVEEVAAAAAAAAAGSRASTPPPPPAAGGGGGHLGGSGSPNAPEGSVTARGLVRTGSPAGVIAEVSVADSSVAQEGSYARKSSYTGRTRPTVRPTLRCQQLCSSAP